MIGPAAEEWRRESHYVNLYPDGWWTRVWCRLKSVLGR